MIPLLPREVVKSIVLHTLNPLPPPRSSVEPVFLQPRTPQETRTLASLVLAFGKQHSQWINEMLWKEITLHSGKMTDRLMQTLQLADSTKNARLVKILHLEFKEYPLLDGDDRKITLSSRGVSPFQIKKLASLLRLVETLCLRATPSGAWFFNLETCQALHRFVNQDAFRTLEADSKHLSYPGLFHLFSNSPRLENLRLRGIHAHWHRTSFRLPPSFPNAISIPPYSLVPSQPPPFVKNLRNLVLSECSLAASHLSTFLFTILLEAPPNLSHLALYNLSVVREIRFSGVEDIQPILDALRLLLPYLSRVTLTLDIPGLSSYNLDGVASNLPNDTLFYHCSTRLSHLTIPAASLFSTSKDQDYFLIYLNSHDSVAPSELAVFCDRRWYLWIRPNGIFRELSRIIDDHWLRKLEILKIVGFDKVDVLGGLEELQQRIEGINEQRKEDGKKSLKLRIESARDSG
ncbi:hypothetical protein JCM3765_006117 [Sporobolomyces pararoseus]